MFVVLCAHGAIDDIIRSIILVSRLPGLNDSESEGSPSFSFVFFFFFACIRFKFEWKNANGISHFYFEVLNEYEFVLHAVHMRKTSMCHIECLSFSETVV